MEKLFKSVELCTCIFIWTLANFYCLYKLFESQNYILDSNFNLAYNLKNLQPGWHFLNRQKDVSDIIWGSWKYFIQSMWCYLVIQLIVSEFVRKLSKSYLKGWYIISSIIIVVHRMGLRQLLAISAYPFIYIAVIFLNGGKLITWLTSLVILMNHSLLRYNTFYWTFLKHENPPNEEIYLVLFAIAWTQLRCLSFCFDYMERDKIVCNSSTVEILANMSSYIFYTPFLFTGPVILYEDFEKSFCVKNEKLLLKLRRFTLDIILLLTYTVILECSIHYIHFYAMQNNIELIRKLSPAALCGGALFMGLQFHMQYVIAYGTTAAIARLDNLNSPPTPRCIARIHVYSQMWRCFDVGLYKFLLKYIYKPSCIYITQNFKVSKMICKLTASFFTFMFVFVWHGIAKRNLVWCLLNYLGIILEQLSKLISEGEKYKRFKRRILKTDVMESRFIALLCVPLVCFSAISNMHLVAHAEVINLFFECFKHPLSTNSILISISLFCGCRVAMVIKNLSSRTDAKM